MLPHWTEPFAGRPASHTGTSIFDQSQPNTPEQERNGARRTVVSHIGTIVAARIQDDRAPPSANAQLRPGWGRAKVMAMIGVVLVLLERPEAAPAALAAADRLAGFLGGARIDVLVVRLPPEATILPSEEVLTRENAARIRGREMERAAALKAIFDPWAVRVQRQDVSVKWCELEGPLEEVVMDRGRRADVGSCCGSRSAATACRPSGRSMSRCSKPTGLLRIVPRGLAAPFGHRVAIAWRDDPHATRAVLSAPALPHPAGAGSSCLQASGRVRRGRPSRRSSPSTVSGPSCRCCRSAPGTSGQAPGQGAPAWCRSSRHGRLCPQPAARDDLRGRDPLHAGPCGSAGPAAALTACGEPPGSRPTTGHARRAEGQNGVVRLQRNHRPAMAVRTALRCAATPPVSAAAKSMMPALAAGGGAAPAQAGRNRRENTGMITLAGAATSCSGEASTRSFPSRTPPAAVRIPPSAPSP